MLLRLAPLPPETMQGQVVSATSERLVVMLPEWSEDVLFRVRRGTRAWPGGNDTPAVNLTYECQVDVSGDIPRILRMYPDRVERAEPTPLLAPGGLPGPPDLLPILDPPALSALVREHFRKTPDKEREKILYLVRRAYGQGMRKR